MSLLSYQNPSVHLREIPHSFIICVFYSSDDPKKPTPFKGGESICKKMYIILQKLYSYHHLILKEDN